MVTRITGLASGMDIDATVTKLMKAEKAPLTKLTQDKQLVEWKREGYRDVSTKLVSFLNDKLNNLSLSSSINAQKATVTGNSTAVSATATGSASGGVLNISVQGLASATNVTSNTGAGAHAGTEALSNVYSGTDPIVINGQTINIESTDTINSFIQKINSNKDAGVTAVFDPNSGKMSLTNKSTGNSPLTFSGAALEAFGIKAGNVTSNLGKDAELTVNGLAITQKSNSFSMNGVDITLNTVTPAGQTTQVSVTPDTDTLVKSVQTFVDAYNDVLSMLNSKVGEERYKKYAPLTDEQKKDLSDDEQKLWNTKAKSGMLKGDDMLQQTISTMRTAMIQGVTLSDGSKVNFAQLGITTGTYETRGKLSLDTEKLKTALAKDPNIVNNFFGAQDSATSSTNKYTDQDGMLSRMKKITKSSLESLASTAGTSRVSSDANSTFLVNSLMGTQLTGMDRRISDWNSRLNTIETNYYKKFTAMETAISRYNNQSTSLSSL